MIYGHYLISCHIKFSEQDLEPSKVEDELQEEEEGDVDIKVGVVIPDLDQIEQWS